MHAKSASAEHAHALSILPVVSASCPVHELSSPRVDQSASHPVRKLASASWHIYELCSNHCVTAYWTPREYANSLIARLWTSQLTGWSTGGYAD